ncbi:MAG: 50S ribosomal protein L24 [Calditrichaeota bacterium]|nr:MAG: 50S ribosomal protein L24 [Calditrichota bacterium]
MHVQKDDEVIILSGNYRGRKGRVLKVFPDKNRIIVEGINFIKRHTRPSQQNPQGGIIEKEAPIHVSNVMLICPKCNTPTRVAYQLMSGEDKNSRRKTRSCRKCGEMIVSG